MTPEVTLNMPAAKPATRNLARFIAPTIRILLGLLFAVFGLSGFLNFLPQPSTPLPAGAAAFLGALMATGYMFKIIAATQLIVGVLLLANRYVPLALVLLAPFVVNSIAFHLFLEPSGRPMAFLVLASELYLAWVYRDAYRPLLSARFEAPRN